ncbi:MAG TPA: hypothetical protein VGM24_08340 [Puia sp.]|jgi:hypothetical protein
MKKRIMIIALVLVSITGFSFAADVPSVNNQVLSSFNREFVNARDVKWESHKNFVKASFRLNEMTLYAYYLPNGDQLGVTRFISPNQLPIQLLTSLKKDFSAYWVSDLFEVSGDSGTSYYITIENDSQVKVMVSSDSIDWKTYKVTDKE